MIDSVKFGMAWDKHVGRVGALAVALGIGSAVAVMPGVAWAQPDGAGSASSSDNPTGGSPGRTEAADRPARSADETSESDDATESVDDTESDDDADADTDADTDPDDDTESDDQADPDDATNPDTAEPDDSTAPDTEESPRRSTGAKRSSGTAAPATIAGPLEDSGVAAAEENATQEPPSAAEVETTPPATDEDVLDTPAPPVQAPTTPSTPASEPVETVADEPATPTLATVLTSLFSPQVSSNAVDQPEVPGASPLLWTLLAYARRDFDRTPVASSTSAASSTAQGAAVQADAVSPAIPGSSYQSPVIAPDGTIYQVTSDTLGGTRVTILDSNGQILATSSDIRGSQAYNAVARPDNTLIVVTTEPVFFNLFDRTLVSSVDSQGAVTRIASLSGFADRQAVVGADGSVYLSTSISIQQPVTPRSVPNRFVRISPTNTVRTFAPDTTFELKSDGTAYLVSSQSGFSTLRVIPPTGFTRTIPLPYGSDPSAPILGQDGTVYVTAGVKGLFGSKTTRLYTLNGTSSMVRTIAGLPGRTLVGADGVYLESFTYPGSTDNGTAGTTYISRITSTDITTSTPITGRIAYLQATEAGTVYAPINDPSLTTTPVKVVSPDGTVTTVTLPGRLVARDAKVIGGGSQAAEDFGYVNYAADGTEYVAVLNPDATVARVITLPTGGSGGSVFFGPDGAAYQLVSYRDAAGNEVSRQILALSTDTFTANVAGTSFSRSVNDVFFGPNGIGYLVTNTPVDPNTPPDQVQDRSRVDVLGFNAAGDTVVRSSGLSGPVIEFNGEFDQPLVFGPDGTAYLTIYNFLNPDQSGVYTLTTSGVQKVADLEYIFANRAHLPTFSADGTGYVTTGDFFGTIDEQSTVTVFSTTVTP